MTWTETTAGGFFRDFPSWLPERLAIFIPVAFKNLKAVLVFSYEDKKDTVFLADVVDVVGQGCFFSKSSIQNIFSDIHLLGHTLFFVLSGKKEKSLLDFCLQPSSGRRSNLEFILTLLFVTSQRAA